MFGVTLLTAAGDVPADLWAVLLLDTAVSGCLITLAYLCCCGARSPGRPSDSLRQPPPSLPRADFPDRAARDTVRGGRASRLL